MSFEKFEPKNPPAAESSEQPAAAVEKEEKPADFYANFEGNFNIKQEELEQIEEFKNLTEGQKALVLENFSQLSLAKIKESAAAETSQQAKETGFLGRVWRGVFKNYYSAKAEKAAAQEFQQGGLEMHEKALRDVAVRVQESGLDVKLVDGRILIEYAGSGEGLNERERSVIENFNETARQFSQLPFEWGEKTAEKAKRIQYEKSLEDFQAAKRELLHLKRDQLDDNKKAAAEVLEIERKVYLDKSLNYSPEAEEALQNMRDQKVLTQAFKNIAFERGGYMAFGYAARTVTVGLLGFVGAPLVAAGLGGFMARKRAAETLREKEFAARRGGKERASKEFQNIIDAEQLTVKIERLKDLISREENEDKRKQLLSSLEARLNYTHKKMADGLVNFGGGDKVLNNQYNLLSVLSSAEGLARAETVGGNKELNERLENFVAYKEISLDKAKKLYVWKAMVKGAVLGAGFAITGYAIRHYFGDEIQSVYHSVKEKLGFSVSGRTIETEAQKLVQEHPATFEEPPPEPESRIEPEAAGGPVRPGITEREPTDKWGIPTPEEVTEKLQERFEKQLELATIGKGEGVEHAFIRQLEADPSKWGYKGDINNVADIDKWAGTEAHIIAIKTGYVTEAGEVRVGIPDKAAYVLEKDPTGMPKITEYLEGKPSGGAPPETIEYYEYGYKPPASEALIIEPPSPEVLNERIGELNQILKDELSKGEGILRGIKKLFGGGPNPEQLTNTVKDLSALYGLDSEHNKNLFVQYLTQGKDNISAKSLKDYLLPDGSLDIDKFRNSINAFNSELQKTTLPTRADGFVPRLIEDGGIREEILVRRLSNETCEKFISEKYVGVKYTDVKLRIPVDRLQEAIDQAHSSVAIETAVPSAENYFDVSTYITKSPGEKLDMLITTLAGGETIEGRGIEVFLRDGQLIYRTGGSGGSETVLTSENLKDFEELADLK